MRSRSRFASIIAVALLTILGPGCVTNGVPAGDEIPALATGVAIVALDIRQIIADKNPTPAQINQLFDDLDALVPLIPDPTIRVRLASIIMTMRSAFAAGMAIKAVVTGSVDDLRDLRDEFRRRIPTTQELRSQ